MDQNEQRSIEPDEDRIAERLTELEGLVEELESVPDAQVVGLLDRAVALLEEVNVRIESGLSEAEVEARELDGLLRRVDFGPLDEALEDLQEERPAGE